MDEFFATAVADLLASEPLSNDGATLRNDSAPIFHPNITLLDITTGDFVSWLTA